MSYKVHKVYKVHKEPKDKGQDIITPLRRVIIL